MTSISGLFVNDLMRRSLLGAHAQDPVVPDRPARRAPRREPSTIHAPLRLGRYDDGLAMLLDPPSRRRVGTFAEGMARTHGALEVAPSIDPREPVAVHDGADQRRAA